MLRSCRRIRRTLLNFSSTRKYSSYSSYNFRPMDIQAEPHTGGQDARKRQTQGGRGGPKRQKTRKEKPMKEGDEVLIADIRALFGSLKVKSEDIKIEASGQSIVQNELPEPFTEIEVRVLEISSTGDGLAINPSSNQESATKHSSSNQIYVVPFSTPGDLVKVKVIKHNQTDHYSLADFVSVIEAGPLRDDSRINCKYFSTCSGCQFQMMDYPSQLQHKKTIVEKAYRNFSKLPPQLVPAVQDTIGSPLQYGYRTKLTPHFDGPPGSLSRQEKMSGKRLYFDSVPNIGFNRKGLQRTLDIEDCPIGTPAVRMGMKRERERVGEELDKYRRGATILLRESTLRVKNEDEKAGETITETIKSSTDSVTEFKSCITDNNGTSTEYIDDFVFTNTAGAFFQNNNSILPSFTQYIRDHIMPPNSSATDSPIKYLIDAYSGSGLFTITLSSLFTTSTGIDISGPSIVSARENARLNNLPSSQCNFIAADAPELFKSVAYPRDETVVVIDPPRKGCDESFLTQLLKFGPKRVVYVSCNVHTQARDVGVLVKGVEDGGVKYEIESLRGFDFFPQTGHVEGVAVLSRVESVSTEAQ